MKNPILGPIIHEKLVGGLEHEFYPYLKGFLLGMSSYVIGPQLTKSIICQRGCGQPPTIYIYTYILTIINSIITIY
jgi:hypothetical protein